MICRENPTSSQSRLESPQKHHVARLFAAPVLALGLVATAGCSLFDDAPKKASIDDAAKNVKEATSGASGDSASAAGKWTIDTETGEFDFESATGTFAGFRVEEELASIGSTTAVGRTGDVSGTIEIADAGLTSADITVDMTTITTDQSMRNNKVQSALETTKFPTANFKVDSETAFDVGVADDVTVKVSAKGQLTIHGVTKDVAFPLEAKKVGATLIVVGALDVKLSDYGVTAPKAPAVLSVSDSATIEFNLLFKRA